MLKPRTVVTLVLVLSFAIVRSAVAGSPMEALQTEVDRVLAVLDNPALKGTHNAERRSGAVSAIVDEVFDFEEASKLALGAHWRDLSPPDRAEFVQLFRGFIKRVYLTNVDGFDGKITLGDEAVEGDRATVRATVVKTPGSPLPVEFRLARDGGARWRLYDVKFEGMSLVGGYRAQFLKIIRAGSYDDLVKKLRAKEGGS